MHVILLMIMHCDISMTREEISKDVALFGDELDDFLQPLINNKVMSMQDKTLYLNDRWRTISS